MCVCVVRVRRCGFVMRAFAACVINLLCTRARVRSTQPLLNLCVQTTPTAGDVAMRYIEIDCIHWIRLFRMCVTNVRVCVKVCVHTN